MASNAQQNPYAFQRAGTMATRSLISDPKPSQTSSNEVDLHGKPTLQRKTTDHYEKAAAATTQSGQLPATTAASAAASFSDGPASFQRQQSWKRSDLKGQHQAQMLASKPAGQGYSSV